jgi:4-amino-4-deoxy-L-arabinose transferase-like glycosyltransferase
LQPSVLAKRAWFVLFIIIAAFYLWGLGSFSLVGPDEPRYAEVAREMLGRRDLITPTLGGMPWFEKPPLLYWMMMLSYRLLGVSEYAARLGPAVCGLFTTIFVYWIGVTVSAHKDPQAEVKAGYSLGKPESIGLWTALVWLTSAGAIGFSRAASFDIVLTLTTTGALACFFIAEIKVRNTPKSACGLLSSLSGVFQRGSLLILFTAFYGCVGLSLLAKGLIGLVIIFGVIGLYYVIRREIPPRKFVLSLLWGVPFSLGVAALWFGPMIARHGWTFIDQFIIQHHFARFATNKYHHPAPFYFYLPVMIGLAAPWAIVLMAGLVSVRRWSWRGQSHVDRVRVLALVWLLFPVIFFSFSESKLTGYILPVLPAAALLIGERIACFVEQDRGERVLRLTGIALIVLAVVGSWYAHRRFSGGWSPILLAGGPLLAVGAAAAIRPQLRRAIFLAIAVAVIATFAVSLIWIAPMAAKGDSVRDLLRMADSRGYATAPVAQLHGIERTAEFYAANRLSYGSDGEPVKFEGAGQVIDAARRSGGVVLCFVPVQFESQLTGDKHLETEVIGRNRSVSLIAVRAR